MKKIDEQCFFSQYPQYKNLDELKKSDLLIMPLHNNERFWGAQRDFFQLTQNQNLNCRFYTEDKNQIPFYAEFSAPPPDLIINFGVTVISTLSGLFGIYQFLKERTQGQKFKIKHVIAIKNDYYEMDEFEGTFNDYQKIHQEMELQFKK